MSKTAEVIRLKIATRLACSACGASVNAACDCNAPYKPAGELAAEAITKNPEMSDRAIADAIGVGNKTVSRARQTTVSGDTVAPRTGRDGKQRKLPKPRKIEGLFCKVNPRVTAFLKELDFFPGFIRRLEEWFDANPDLDDEAIFALVNNLTGASIELGRLAQKIDGR